MAMPKSVFYEVIQLSKEYERIYRKSDNAVSDKHLKRLNDITKKLARIEMIYTVDNDQEEFMV